MSKFSLFCLAIAVCAFGSCLASPLMNHIEADGAEKYLNCVEKMQASSVNMKAPFEVLIQGPGSDRFVRSLLGTDASSAEFTDSRLTFSVHQPEAEQSTAEEPPKETVREIVKDAEQEKESQPSCKAENLMEKDDTKSTPQTATTEQKTNDDKVESPIRSKRQSGDESVAVDGALAEGSIKPEDPNPSPEEPKVGSLLGLHAGIPALIGLGHLGLMHKGLRAHHAVGLHHALLPLRHALHHVPLIPLLGAANPNSGDSSVGQENPNPQNMPTSDPQPAGQSFGAVPMMNNAPTMLQRVKAIQERFRMMQGPPPAQAPMPQ